MIGCPARAKYSPAMKLPGPRTFWCVPLEILWNGEKHNSVACLDAKPLCDRAVELARAVGGRAGVTLVGSCHRPSRKKKKAE